MRLITLALCLFLVPAAVAEPPWRYMSKEQEAKVRSTLPKTDDEKLQKILNSPDLMFYDETTLPTVFQEGTITQSNPVYASRYNTDHVVLVYTGRNISMEKQVESAGTPNNEEPWVRTAGLPPGYPSVKALLLPQTGNIKISVGPERRPESKRYADAVSWDFPQGTTLVEILYQKFTDGDQLPFEIRTRTKSDNETGAEHWAVNVYRPVRNETELTYVLGEYRKPSSSPLKMIFPSLHPRLFKPRTALVVEMPKIEKEVSKQTLKTMPFRPALGEPWLVQDGIECGMATTTERDSIVPPRYNGAFFSASKASCVDCHRDTQRHAYDIQNPRPWYGMLRGDDGIISWNPFARVPELSSASTSLDPNILKSGRVSR